MTTQHKTVLGRLPFKCKYTGQLYNLDLELPIDWSLFIPDMDTFGILVHHVLKIKFNTSGGSVSNPPLKVKLAIHGATEEVIDEIYQYQESMESSSHHDHYPVTKLNQDLPPLPSTTTTTGLDHSNNYIGRSISNNDHQNIDHFVVGSSSTSAAASSSSIYPSTHPFLSSSSSDYTSQMDEGGFSHVHVDSAYSSRIQESHQGGLEWNDELCQRDINNNDYGNTNTNRNYLETPPTFHE